jgi:cytoskeletal protein CcmA (bactofilin family)
MVRHLFDTFVIERFAVMTRGVASPAGKDILIGQSATVAGNLDAGQSAFLAKDAIVRGNVHAAVDVVIGAHARVGGDIEAGSDVLILPGARIAGRIRCGGSARLIDATIGGDVDARGDVVIGGETRAKDIRTQGRIRVLEASNPPTGAPSA